MHHRLHRLHVIVHERQRDDSDEHADTWAFLDRGIEDVMRFEKFKAQVRENPLLSRVLAGPLAVLGQVRAPGNETADLPGKIGG